MEESLLNDLRTAYDRRAEWRDKNKLNIQDWKVAERANFLAYLQQENKKTLLEIGAGPGRDSLFFQKNGLEVVATDLSPEMVRLSREKGLTAHVMDFDHLAFAKTFEAIYALNCLLHVPKKDLPAILGRIQTLLQPGGLFFMGVYGGEDWEGVYDDDEHDPKRFYSLYSNEHIQMTVGQYFTLVYFHEIPMTNGGHNFQSMIWRRE